MTIMRTSVLGLLAAVGCGSSGGSAMLDASAADSGIDSRPSADAGFIDPNGTDHQYVVSYIYMPVTAAQANQFGLNIDGDAQGRPDNALGQILVTLAGHAGPAFDLQNSVGKQVNRADILLLVNVKAASLATSPGVGTSIYLGTNPSTAPCLDALDNVCGRHLDGSTTFDVSNASPSEPPLAGAITNGNLIAGPGNVTISLSLVQGGAPLTLNLVGARIDVAAVTESGFQGRLGGAITKASLDDEVLPALQGIIADTIARDCTGNTAPCCDPGSDGDVMIALFDESMPEDCVVTLGELENNSLISSLLAPDVDLFDGDPANGNYAPRADGVKDSLSLGVGFQTTSAVFALP